MFLTAFAGVIDLRTGVVTCVNAGHNPPVLKHADGKTDYLRLKPSLVLSASARVKYTEFPVQLAPGDRLLLYTDGVTEAMNPDKALWGEERLLAAVSEFSGTLPDMLEFIHQQVTDFAATAPQNDDITMLLLEYSPQWQD